MANKYFWGVNGSGDHTGLIEFDGASTDTNVVSVTSDDMNKNPEADTEDGYITVNVNGTEYQIPIYQA